MKITIKVAGGRQLDEELDSSFTVLDLKALISDSTSLAVEEMRLLHKGRALHDADTASSMEVYRTREARAC